MTYYRTNDTKTSSSDDVELLNSYDHVFTEAKNQKRFDDSLLNKSRGFFEFDHLSEPVPKNLGVDALVCGLPFADSLINLASNVQKKLDKYLDLTDRYWVEPNNLACEIVVSKWPGKSSNRSIVPRLVSFLDNLNLSPFTIRIHGAQMHTDGCVVLRGYDRGRLRGVRSALLENFSDLPQKQSSWVHIPLGRIISQVSENTYKCLLNELISSFDEISCDIEISDLKYITEKQWYMMEREIIAEIKLKESFSV